LPGNHKRLFRRGWDNGRGVGSLSKRARTQDVTPPFHGGTGLKVKGRPGRSTKPLLRPGGTNSLSCRFDPFGGQTNKADTINCGNRFHDQGARARGKLQQQNRRSDYIIACRNQAPRGRASAVSDFESAKTAAAGLLKEPRIWVSAEKSSCNPGWKT